MRHISIIQGIGVVMKHTNIGNSMHEMKGLIAIKMCLTSTIKFKMRLDIL